MVDKIQEVKDWEMTALADRKEEKTMAESMKDFEKELEESMKKIEEGDILTGTVISVDEKNCMQSRQHWM